jgi:hypothetical protein
MAVNKFLLKNRYWTITFVVFAFVGIILRSLDPSYLMSGYSPNFLGITFGISLVLLIVPTIILSYKFYKLNKIIPMLLLLALFVIIEYYLLHKW